MKTLRLRIEFLSPWHAGTGLGGGPEADALVLRDAQGLHYLPGRTILGLLREAVHTLEDSGVTGASEVLTRLFGEEDRGHPGQALLDVRNAVPESAFAARLVRDGLTATLTDRFTSTAIDDKGLARDKSMRSIEATVPLTLLGRISFPADDEALLQEAVKMVRTLGRGRHRGFGRCVWSLEDLPAEPAANQALATGEKARTNERWFRITLRSEVFISRTGGTLTAGEGLDYLPGSLFLGAVASCQRDGQRLFQKLGAAVFSSGRLRFGDGLPLAAAGRVGLPMPLSLHRWKRQEGGIENFAAVPERIGEAYADKFKAGWQPKQQREGYYVPGQGGKPGAAFQLETPLRLKTAINRDHFDRSEDERIFGYRVLPAGARFVLRIAWDGPSEAAPWDDIEHALCRQPLRLGRSRRAEYGSAEAEPIEPPRVVHPAAHPPDDRTCFLLLSDTLLLQAGRPVLAPVPEAFGLDAKEWEWDVGHSFIRTRRYSPWNWFINSRTVERQMLTRGSVIVFRRVTGGQPASPPIELGGQAEGLGWWVRDPDFLWQVKLPLPAETEAYSCHREKVPDESKPPQLAPIYWHVFTQLKQRKKVLRDELSARELAEYLVGQLQSHAKAQAYRLPRRQFPGPAQWAEVRGQAQASMGDVKALLENLTKHCGGTAARKQAWIETDFLEGLTLHLGKPGISPRVLVRSVALAATLMREAQRKEESHE